MRRSVLLLTAMMLATVLVPASPAAAQTNDPNPRADNWVVSTYNVTFPNLTYVEVDGTLRFHKIHYDGQSYSADDARDLYHLLYQRNPGSAEALVEDFERKITERFRAAMDRIFSGANLTVTPATLDRDSLNTTREGAGEYHPPLVFHVGAEGPVDLTALAGQNVNQTVVDVALQIGATLEVPFPLTASAGTNMTMRLDVPNDLTIARAEDATVGPQRQVATATVHNWRSGTSQSQEVLVAVRDPTQEVFTKQQATLDVTVDVHGLDLDLLAIPSGSLGTARADVRAQGSFRVLEVPAEATEGFGGVDITHVSASDLRLLVREGLVERSALTDLASNFLSGFVEDAPDNVEVTVTGGIDPASLDVPPADEVNETDPPVRLDVEANVLIGLDLGQASGQQAAFTLYDTRQSFTLEPVNGIPTTYKIILPKGTTLLDAQAPGGEATHGTTDDGRSVLTVTTTDEPVDTQVHAAITPSFLWHQVPELLALALVGLLLPIALLTWAILRRRGGDEFDEGGEYDEG